jgi:hypothetical protein
MERSWPLFMHNAIKDPLMEELNLKASPCWHLITQWRLRFVASSTAQFRLPIDAVHLSCHDRWGSKTAVTRLSCSGLT